MEEKKGISKKIIIFVFIFSILLLFLIVFSFSIYTNEPVKVKNETLDGGEVSLTYTDDENVFSIDSSTPTSDITGKKLDSADKYFDFSVSTTIDEANEIEYEISVKKLADKSTIKDEEIKIYLEKQKKGTYTSVFEPSVFMPLKKDTKLGSKEGSMVLTKETVSKDTVDNYRLRMWLADTAVVDANLSRSYSVEIIVNAKSK